ncbi:MAG TPA: F0F1 ATP synthase subunit A [Bacillales bacterium]|nr:F0F1 ATP synthase subunit A [Bacillales bacterium]
MEAFPTIDFLGLKFNATLMIGTVVTMILVLLLVIAGTRGRRMRPQGMQNVMEMLIEFVQGITRVMMEPKQASKYLSFAFTTFLFIFIANQLGVIVMIGAEATEPIPSLGLSKDVLESVHHEVSWFNSPTAHLSATVALAFAIALYAHFAGLFKDPKQYFKHYFQPYWPMFFIHIIDEIAKPTTHAARLWANIFAGEVLILILRQGMPLLTGAPLIVWLGFSVFVGAIQAYIFTVLAMVYISQKVADDH